MNSQRSGPASSMRRRDMGQGRAGRIVRVKRARGPGMESGAGDDRYQNMSVGRAGGAFSTAV